MDYFVEQGPTDYDVQALIRKKYGDRARIMARKEIRTGGILGLFRRRAVEVTGYCTHAPHPRNTSRSTITEERKKILAAAVEGTGKPAPQIQNNDAVIATVPESRPDRRGEENAAAQQGGGSSMNGEHTRNNAFGEVLAEIRSLKEQIGAPGQTGPSSITELKGILEQNDFSRSFVDSLVAELHGTYTFDQLNDFDFIAERAVERISESIDIYPWQERRRKPHVFVLVGPTGVGKTTTIAKLAAMYGAVADPSYDVRILTIDSYRIGALQQIEKYGEIMGIPVHGVETVEEMEKQLALNREADFIFVDTIGKSPNDFAKLADVNRLVRAADGEVHLAMSATTKRSDMLDILRHFEPFNYQGVVITKLDETSTIGGVVSALQEKRKSVSFVTDGQSVPQDIERARRHTFMRRLRDLPVARREPEPAYKE